MHPLARDADNQLVEMPLAIGAMMPLPNIGSNRLSELVDPATDGLAGHIDSALRDQIVDVSQAHGELEIEPSDIADNIGRKTMLIEEYGFIVLCLTTNFQYWERLALV